MKLIREILQRRMEIMKDLELNHENFKFVWHFYQIYQISANVLGINPHMKEKNDLIKKLLLSPDNLIILGKIKEFLVQDNKIIEICLDSIVEKEEVGEIFEDFYPISVFGVNLDDRDI